MQVFGEAVMRFCSRSMITSCFIIWALVCALALPFFPAGSASAQDGGAGSRLTFAQSLYLVDGAGPTDSATVVVTLADAVEGETINWSLTSPGGDNGATLGAVSSPVRGKTASVQVSGKGVQRSVVIQATLQSEPARTASATVQFGEALPSGFLTGPSMQADGSTALTMDWNTAKAYCASQGGRLPLINGSTSWDGSGAEKIDGFGVSGAPWPSSFPTFEVKAETFFWTGTGFSLYPVYTWIIHGRGGNVTDDDADPSSPLRVACVPQ